MSKITKYRVEIDVYYYSNAKDLRKEFKKRLKESGFAMTSSVRSEGFADKWWGNHKKEIKTGEIHVPMPRDGIETRPAVNPNSIGFREETMGHELRHIIEGHFHSVTLYKKKKKGD